MAHRVHAPNNLARTAGQVHRGLGGITDILLSEPTSPKPPCQSASDRTRMKDSTTCSISHQKEPPLPNARATLPRLTRQKPCPSTTWDLQVGEGSITRYPGPGRGGWVLSSGSIDLDRSSLTASRHFGGQWTTLLMPGSPCHVCVYACVIPRQLLNLAIS